MMECTFEYFVALLISGAYLSNLLSAIGMSDAMVGMVSSLASLAFIFQLISMFLIQKITNTKMLASFIHLGGRMFFVTLYFIPFFDFIPDAYKGVTAMICIALGYLGNYMVTTIIYKWGNSFVHPSKRATFSATKEMLSLICGMVFTFVMGQAVDYYDQIGKSDSAFIFLGVTILIATISDFVCLMIMKREYKPDKTVRSEPLSKVLGELVKNKSYVCLVILDCLHKAAVYVLSGFMGTFQLKELGMTVGLVSIVSIISNGARFLVSRPIGRFSDKTSYVTGITLGLAIKALGYIFIVIIKPDLWWMVIIYQVLYNISVAATNQNLMSAVYSYVDKEHFVHALSIKNCTSGIVGFLVSLVAAAIVRAVQGESGTGVMHLFGMDIYVQQFLALISLILTVITFLFALLVMRKRKIIGK